MRIIKNQKHCIFFGFMNKSLIYNEGTCYKYNTTSYKLCGGRNLMEDGIQSGINLRYLKIGEALNLTVDY